MSAVEKKTVLRTIRITEQLDRLLEKDSEGAGLSVNALISSILRKYFEWDRYAQRFGFISMTRTTFRAIIEAIDEKKLIEVAQKVGAQTPKSLTLFWFGKANIETFKQNLFYMSKYAGGLFENEVKKDGENYTITFRHDLGEKWSSYLSSLYREAVKIILGVTPQIEASVNTVVISFSVHQA